MNNVFLNGDLREDVFMTKLEGFVDPTKPNHVCKFHKALHGLKQAPRAWFEKLKSALIAWVFRTLFMIHHFSSFIKVVE